MKYAIRRSRLSTQGFRRDMAEQVSCMMYILTENSCFRQVTIHVYICQVFLDTNVLNEPLRHVYTYS